MLADSALPADVAPSPAEGAAGDAILVTGATGFLGSHLVAALLRQTQREVLCLSLSLGAFRASYGMRIDYGWKI